MFGLTEKYRKQFAEKVHSLENGNMVHFSYKMFEDLKSIFGDSFRTKNDLSGSGLWVKK